MPQALSRFIFVTCVYLSAKAAADCKRKSVFGTISLIFLNFPNGVAVNDE